MIPSIPTIYGMGAGPIRGAGGGGAPGGVSFDVVVNFSDGAGALTAAKLNNGTHGAVSWGTWTTPAAITHTNIEDHAAALPFDILCDGVTYNGSESGTQGLTFDFAAAPTADDVFQYTLSGSRSDCVFLLLVKYATIASGSPTSYNNDTLVLAGANYTVIQRQHSFNGTKSLYCHSEGDLGSVIPDDEGWMIVCGKHSHRSINRPMTASTQPPE